MQLNAIISLIKKTAIQAGQRSGIYKMIGKNATVIYVGKAKYLKNRLNSYTRVNNVSTRIKTMISNIEQIEFTIVKSETEALLLENNLIKEYQPFYNILLKDNKTFPYIMIDTSTDYPRIYKYRTQQPQGKDFYGPYPLSVALNETIKIIQKIFLLRTCSNNCLYNRKRPCLQYFIKKCSAPCCSKITKEEYKKNVELTRNFLLGQNDIVQQYLLNKMKEASKNLEFENAAKYRDQINAINTVLSKQYIQINTTLSIDFIALAQGIHKSIIAVTFFRNGKNVGTNTFLLDNTSIDDSCVDIIQSFISQFYQNTKLPSYIVTRYKIGHVDQLLNINIICAETEEYKRILESTQINANIKLENSKNNYNKEILEELGKLIGQNTKLIKRIESYDNSHIHGAHACGVMVVWENGSIQKSKVRRFNITEEISNGGDDISMMKHILTKRFSSNNIKEIPDLLIIDGGKNQINAVRSVLDNLSINIKILGIAKQNNRTEGDEKLVLENGSEIFLGRNSKLLNFIIELRNEAHNQVIGFHRKKRRMNLQVSLLDQIPGIGKIKKQKLLEYFGSIESIKSASIDSLQMVKGINKNLAVSIYNFMLENKK